MNFSQFEFVKNHEAGRALINTFTLFILMYYPIQIDEIVWKSPFCILRGCRQKFISDVLMSLKIVFTLANSADSDEMPHFVAFHLGLHCLPK